MLHAALLVPLLGIGLPQDVREVPPPASPPPGALVGPPAATGEPVPGERLSADAIGPLVIETMEAVLAREAERPPWDGTIPKLRNGRSGAWIVPSRRETYATHSGEHCATVRWGDRRIGIGFAAPVVLEGAWLAAQGARGAWAPAVRAVLYRDGREIGATGWHEIVREPTWLAIGTPGADRVVFEAKPAYRGAGFWSLDDLSFVRAAAGPGGEPERVVLGFDDLPWEAVLTGSSYGGLDWEQGQGVFDLQAEEVHPPQAPPGVEEEPPPAAPGLALSAGALAPEPTTSFRGPRLGDAGAGWLPPDTCGAVGPTHYVAVVNQHLSVYDKTSGQRLVSTSLQSFFATGGSAGDPRVAWDDHAGRWVVIASDFSDRIFFGWSLGADATGSWLKTTITLSSGSDAGAWPDYPTLGLDANGIYVGAYMVGNSFRMSLFAIDKAPLLAPTPALGAVTAWRQLPWEGALQAAVHVGPSPGAYVVTRRSSTGLRLRRVNPPLAAPTLSELGTVAVPSHGSPPTVPAQGSTVELSTVDWRLMNAFWRAGSLWTAHTVDDGSGRAVCRWYEIDTATVTTAQVGTVADPVRHYFFPALAADAAGNVLIGFSAASGSEYAGAWFTGRGPGDPPGATAPPAPYHAGEDAYNYADTGSNRWGDYSLTAVDPVDDTLWTIQEYAALGNAWSTWIGRFRPGCLPPFQFCATSPNSVGAGAVMTWSGNARISDNDLGFDLIGLPPLTLGLFYAGQNETLAPFGNGLNCIAGPVLRFAPTLVDTIGAASTTIDFAAYPGNQMSPGETWHVQFWYRNPAGGGAGFNTSDGVGFTLCP